MGKITTAVKRCKKIPTMCANCIFALYTWNWKRGCKITGEYRGNKMVGLTLEEEK